VLTYVQQFGVPVVRAVQEEGSFIVTCPNAYHGGFSHGVRLLFARDAVPFPHVTMFFAVDRLQLLNQQTLP